MRERVCNNCGGKKYQEIGQNMVKCLFCGTIYVDEYANKEEEILIVHAYEKIRDFKFDEAVTEFDKILSLYPKSHEAYYGRLQAKKKVVYFSNKEGNKRYPSFFGKEIPSYFEDDDFKKAVEFAPKEIAESYNDQASYVEKLKEEWLSKAKNLPNYDVILNIKNQTDIAKKIIANLKEKKLNVFLREDVKKERKNIEAYLFQAAQTAKTEILVLEDDDILNEPKIKNLYQRFIYRIDIKDRFPSSFVVVCDDKKVKIDDIKKAFPFLTKLYLTTDASFVEDLGVYIKSACERSYNEDVKIEKRVVENVTPKKKEKVDVVNVVPSDLGHYNIESVPLSNKNRMKWIFYSIKNGDFQTAENLIKEEKEVDEKNGELYFASILCEKKIKTEEEFFNNISNFQNKESLENILKYSSTEFADDFLNRWENLIINLNDVDTYLTYLEFLAQYNNTGREKFVQSAEALAIDTMDEKLIDAVLKCFSAEDVDSFTNFYFQLAQKSGDENYYKKILELDEGHVQSHFALFMKNFDTVEEKLSYRDGKALENVLKYCNTKQRTGFVTDLIDIILDVDFYDIKKTESQLDFYLSYINDDEILQQTLKDIANSLQSQGFFSLAEKYLTLAIKNDKENAELYWQLMQIKTHCRSESELPTTSVKIAEMEEFKTVLSYANDSQAEKYTQIVASANTTTAKKIFRQEMLDKVVLKEKLQEFISRNNKLLNDVEDKASVNYYKSQFKAFDSYFQKIDEAVTFEQYKEIFDRLFARLECLDLTLDTSVNVAKFAVRKSNLQTLEKEAKKRDEKYLSTIEVAEREIKRNRVLFGVLELAPMLLITLLLVLVICAPKAMYMAFSQNGVIIATILSVLLGLGNLIYNMVKKNSNKRWKIARLSIFILAMVNLFLLLFGFYLYPPKIEIGDANELNKIVHNAGYVDIVLEKDINMEGKDWWAADFHGTVDGNGHKIYNLKFASNNGNFALFDNFGGEIYNITIELQDGVYEDVSNFGVIALDNNGVISNCEIFANIAISSVKDDAVIGGVCAVLGNGNISGTTSNFTLNIANTKSVKLGGVVGMVEEKHRSATFNQNQAISSVKALTSASSIVYGGLIGESNNTDILISESYADVDFVLIGSPNSSIIGGLVGVNLSDVENCYADGNIDVHEVDNSIVGGIIGELKKREQEVKKSYSNIVMTYKKDVSTVGFLVGKLTEGIFRDCFAVGVDMEVYGDKTRNVAIAPEPSNCELFASADSVINKFDFSNEIWFFEDNMLPKLQCFIE